MREESYETKRIDHLGIVAGICKEIDLIECIDEAVGPTDRKVSVGEAVQAMVLNGLGFVGRPLYLTPEFFANKPVDLLIRDGLAAADLNEDSLGRALDRLHERGVTPIFGLVAQHALSVLGLSSRFGHLDSSTFSLHGAYEGPEGDGAEAQPETIQITHGYAKDHRPDLKQATLALICSQQSAIPTWLAALDGNQSDHESLPELLQDYIEQMEDAELDYFIADSALYSAENIQTLSGLKWLSRVPATLKAVKQLYQQVEPGQMVAANESGYRYLEVCSTYADVPQRWLVVFSETSYEREVKTLTKRIEAERTRAEQALNALCRHEYETPETAMQAWHNAQAKWRFHFIQTDQLRLVPHYDGPGRPRKEQSPDSLTWQIPGEIVADEQAIEQARRTKGKFVLATNELDDHELPAETLLTAYKEEGSRSERGFRFLKDPFFFADSLFLKKPGRIMALLMVMGLSLLVYALAEHHLRTQLAERDETLPDQKGNPTQRLTMRRVFQVFEGIDLLMIRSDRCVERRVLNLRPVHLKILDLLGPNVKNCYIPDI
jgi:transposase